MNRLYTPADVANLDYDRDLSLPGRYPFTRGTHPTGDRAKPWTMRMFVGFDLHDDQQPGGEYQEPVYF